MQLPNYPGVDAEKKYKDINGIVFDVAEHDWRQSKEKLMRIVAVQRTDDSSWRRPRGIRASASTP